MQRGCTQCGECLNVCPVFARFRKEEYSPKSKRLLLEPAVGGDSPIPWESLVSLARLCAGCGRCAKACARKLSTADLLADARAAHPHWTQFFWELWIRHLGPLWPSIGLAATLVPMAVVPGKLEASLNTAKALTGKGDGTPWVRLKPGPDAAVNPLPVVLFPGCTAVNVRPRWTAKAGILLAAWGYSLMPDPGFSCCGGTMHHAGQYRAMAGMRERNVNVWRRLGRPRIAVFCASCHHSLAAYGEDVLVGDEVAAWRKGLTPVSALLAGAVAEAAPGAPERYGYHQPCHWEKDMDMPFLASVIPGLVKGAGLCCGMGGILQMTDAPLSASMARSCLDALPGPDILTGCSGCALQLSAHAPKGVTARHWLDTVETG